MSAAGSPSGVPAASPAKTGEDCSRGYRRAGEMRDFALGRSWAIFASCAHPERPRLAVESGDRAGFAPPSFEAAAVARVPWNGDFPPPPAARRQPPEIQAAGNAPAAAGRAVADPVRSGSRVRLWRRDPAVSIDLAGVALGAGAPGTVIRVRVSPGGRVLQGIVRAVGSVELDAAGGTGFSGETQ